MKWNLIKYLYWSSREADWIIYFISYITVYHLFIQYREIDSVPDCNTVVEKVTKVTEIGRLKRKEGSECVISYNYMPPLHISYTLLCKESMK